MGACQPRALTLTAPLSLSVACDFLDLFDVKAQEFAALEDRVFTEESARRPVRRKAGAGGSPALVFTHTDGGFQGRTEVSTSPAPDEVRQGVLTWRLRIKAHKSCRLTLKVTLKAQRRELPLTHDLADFGRGAGQLQGRLNRHRIVSPRLVTPNVKLESTFKRSVADLGALLIEGADVSPGLPAMAGCPRPACPGS